MYVISLVTLPLSTLWTCTDLNQKLEGGGGLEASVTQRGDQKNNSLFNCIVNKCLFCLCMGLIYLNQNKYNDSVTFPCYFWASRN